MKDSLESFIASVVVGACILILLLALSDRTYTRGYKQGQIDAITGTIKYELVVHPDKTSTWEEKK